MAWEEVLLLLLQKHNALHNQQQIEIGEPMTNPNVLKFYSLRELRKAMGLTQKAMGDMAKITQSAYSKLEHSLIPDFTHLNAILRACRAEAVFFISGEETHLTIYVEHESLATLSKEPSV
jgi:DNA-binding XRE family transcriptional regulator